MADAGTDSDRSDAGSGSFAAVSPHASMFKSVSTGAGSGGTRARMSRTHVLR